MARFSAVFAGALLLVAMVAIAGASIITTTSIDDNPVPFGKKTGADCGSKMVQQEMLSHCRMYLTAKGGRRQGGSTMNQAEVHMEECCKQLENMGEMCMCEGIKMMMNMQGWTQQQGQMMSMAENLPTECGYQSCQMRAVWF
ncbi:albumin-8 [Artemisia annua]|uniref:Albumin-8 n=1 Tax=Artemisia annua TaxID=35608 RepID=A0A2U1L4Y0_ARTAN|nr:albumin-8 [Artemisia annua]